MAVYMEWYFLPLIPFAVILFYSGWMNRETVFWLLIASLPFSFEYQLNPSLGLDLPDEILMLGVSLYFACAWLYKPALLSRSVISHPLVILLLVVFSWSLCTAFLSTDQIISFKYILAKTWYLGSFVLAPLVLFRDKKNLKKAAIIFSVSLFAVMMIILFRHGLKGFHFSTINEAASPFFRNHVNYSSMLVLLFPLLLVFYKTVQQKKFRQWILVAMGLFFAALFFTYARGAWLALLAGIAAWVLITSRKLVPAVILAFGMIIFSLYWISQEDRYLKLAHDYKTTIFHSNFSEHLLATYQMKDVSTAERFYRWIAGIRLAGEHGLTGTGPNTFYNNYKPYAVPAYRTWVSNNPDHSTIHNYFLLLLAEQGYPGMVLFLLLVIAMFYYAQQVYSRTKDNFIKHCALAIAVMLAMIVTVNLLSDLIETDKIGSIFYLCLAVLVSVDLLDRKSLNSSADI